MKQISGNSRVTILFTLEWESPGVQHRDEIWTDQVNMWRDSFTPEFAKVLTGTHEGKKVLTEIGADTFYAPYTEKKIAQLPVARFYKPDLPVNPISARLGRYYPQNCLHGVSSVFQTSVAPARCISKEEKFLRFDLNQNHKLPFEDDSFESIVCTASIEYLTDPLAVFAEMYRLLVPSGVFVLAFSNRWFPPKAIKIWTELHEFERLGMVLEMFHRTSGFANINTLTRQGELRPEDDPHPEYSLSDPVYIVWGFKK